MVQTTLTQEKERERLTKSAELVEGFYEELNEIKDPKRNNLPMTLFRALAALTLHRTAHGLAIEDIRFNPKELREKAIEIGFTRKSKQEDSEWVRSNWHNLEEEIEHRKSHLQEFSRRHEADFYPWISKEESTGGQGKFSYYYLTARAFNAQEQTESSVQYPSPEGGVRYIPESLANVPRWARWVNGFTLKSWRKFIYLLPGLLLLLFTLLSIVLVLFSGLYTGISTVKWLSSVIVILGLGGMVLSSPLYRVVWNRIVMAPEWMVPLSETNAQLELMRIGTDPETGNAIRELRLMVYSAQCPLCKGRIEVQGGGLQFPFRLVGRCIESPREHVFSFDHITRTGKPLIL
jgi:hypothetical protein